MQPPIFTIWSWTVNFKIISANIGLKWTELLIGSVENIQVMSTLHSVPYQWRDDRL